MTKHVTIKDHAHTIRTVRDALSKHPHPAVKDAVSHLNQSLDCLELATELGLGDDASSESALAN